MRIFYGICGEGLGHTGRSLAIINELKKQHEVHIFTFKDAYKYLCGTPNLHHIPGLTLTTKNNTVDIKTTLKNALKFKKQIPDVVTDLYRKLDRPNLCITDFEPVVPRLSQIYNVPCISIDNQHKFCLSPKGLPLKLKLYSFVAGKFINWFIPDTVLNIITTFHECDNCTNLVNPVIRQELINITPYPQPFILVYIKECLENTILPILKDIPEENFIIYGSTRTTNDQNLIFKEISPAFAQDLANCQKVICTAGNQLIGEAKYFSKPVFTIPLPNQTEQAVNAFYVKNDSIGTSCNIKCLSTEKIRKFIETAYHIDTVPNGLDQIMELLNPYLYNV